MQYEIQNYEKEIEETEDKIRHRNTEIELCSQLPLSPRTSVFKDPRKIWNPNEPLRKTQNDTYDNYEEDHDLKPVEKQPSPENEKEPNRLYESLVHSRKLSVSSSRSRKPKRSKIIIFARLNIV